MFNFEYFLQAVGIVFRESLEAVLIYAIIVGFFCKSREAKTELLAARWGLGLGVLVSGLLGLGLAGLSPYISNDTFSYLEIVIIFAGSLLMLYMVFWMQRHARTMKTQLEDHLRRAASLASILGTVFVAVFREGVETVVYLYSLSLQNSEMTHQFSLVASLFLGVILSFLVYRLILRGSNYLSMQTVFRITGFWLIFSSSALFATGIDKLFAAGFFESWSGGVVDLSLPEQFARISTSIESLTGFRFQPSPLHFVSFLIFWCFVIYKDPLDLRKRRVPVRSAPTAAHL